jgi:hypothetical protein
MDGGESTAAPPPREAAIQVPELLADEVRHLVLAVTLAPRPVALNALAMVARALEAVVIRTC